MHEFDTIVPVDLGQCLGVLAEAGTEASLIAGGTDLHILMKSGLRMPRLLIHISRIVELTNISDSNGRIAIGSAVPHSRLASFASGEGIDCLALAAGSIGSPQIRNMATAGGNIANASPAADLYPALMVLDASVVLRNSRRTRKVRLEELVIGPGETAIEPDEVITELVFEKPDQRCFTGFIKIGLRNALAISVASAAIYATSRQGRLDDVRIACGAVAPRPIRMRHVEDLLTGKQPTAELISQAEGAACDHCNPISDIRATAEYRRHVSGVIIARLLETAVENLIHGKGKRDDV
jgi:carbon-monoxide dehydrogenase medium subunit